MVVPILNVNCLIILKKHNFALLLNVSLSWSEKKKKFNFEINYYYFNEN